MPTLLLGAAPHCAVASVVGERRLRVDLDDCVTRIADVVRAEPMIIPSDVAAMCGGGAPLRPLLVLACAYAARPQLPPARRDLAVRSAVVVELLRLARRARGESGNAQALVAGDYLIGCAQAAACAIGEEAGAVAAQTLVRLCEGQAEEAAARFDVHRRDEAYYVAIAGKTGALFEAAAQLGALAAGLGPAPAAALAEYGSHLGIACQLVDDLRDVTASTRTAGQDIVAGVYTLPVLHALRARPELAAVLRDPDRNRAAREAVQIVGSTDAVERTRLAVQRQLDLAARALSTARLRINATAMLTALSTALVDERLAAAAEPPAAAVRPLAAAANQ
ncbi:MAG TPA: polyprenyl synthetase family protein [Jatrophihabitantaceae bacterium]|jgi:heptaprenyl diphosphate synthase